ncbi:DAGLA [Symbiodinium sp. CCMP2456]|nr:DAGLA [Symbiodinium sp. CCMP2456]
MLAQYWQALLGGPRAELGWTEFAGRLLTRVARIESDQQNLFTVSLCRARLVFCWQLCLEVKTPWLTRTAPRSNFLCCVLIKDSPGRGAADIFAQLQAGSQQPWESVFCFSPEVRSTKAPLGEVEAVVRVPDLVQALLGSEDFAVEVGPRSAVCQCVRPLAELSELFHEKPDTAIRMWESFVWCGEPRLEAAELSAVRFVPADACRGTLWLLAESCESSAPLLFLQRQMSDCSFGDSPAAAAFPTTSCRPGDWDCCLLPLLESLQAELRAEQSAAAEHLLLRGMPVAHRDFGREAQRDTPSQRTEALIRQAASFEAHFHRKESMEQVFALTSSEAVELRVVSVGVKLETEGIAQELRRRSRALSAGLVVEKETETEQFQTQAPRQFTRKSVIITKSDHPLQESFWDALLLAGLREIGPAGGGSWQPRIRSRVEVVVANYTSKAVADNNSWRLNLDLCKSWEWWALAVMIGAQDCYFCDIQFPLHMVGPETCGCTVDSWMFMDIGRRQRQNEPAFKASQHKIFSQHPAAAVSKTRPGARNVQLLAILSHGMQTHFGYVRPRKAAAKIQDSTRSGKLSAAQLRAALAQMDLGLSSEGGAGMSELEEFAGLLAAATQKKVEQFDYASLVSGGSWKGPTLEDAVATVCRGSKSLSKPASADKRHMLSILFYKTAEAAKKLGLSAQRAFDGLDRGSKGFLNAEDLRLAVLQIVGGDQSLTLKDLGILPSTRLNFPDFEKRLNFDFGLLSKHMGEVFSDEPSISESDFVNRLSQIAGLDKATLQSWLQLMYPGGCPVDGVGRGACETFLATTPALVPGSTGAVLKLQGFNIRAELMKDAEAEGTAGTLPAWVAVSRGRDLLKKLAAKDADQLVKSVAEVSAKYPAAAPQEVIAGARMKTESEAPLRTETLLSCAESERVVEHILEVTFKSVTGFSRAAEVFIRYSCYGTNCVADAPASAQMDFSARHVFGLSSSDSLAKLFEGRDHAFTIQAWIAVAKDELRRPLAVAVVPAAELRSFLESSLLERPRPEAVLGSQRKWALSFTPVPITDPKLKKPPLDAVKGDVELVVHYSRRPNPDPQRMALPWNSSFAGRLVVCRKGVASVTCDDPEEAPSGLAPREEVPKALPPPGSVIIKISIVGLQLQADALRGLVARCLQGQLLAAPGSVGGLVSKAPKFFMRLCLFPGKPAMQVAGCGGWVESGVKPVPENLLAPASLAKPEGAQVKFDFSWSSPPLEASQAVQSLQDGVVALEVWIRHPAADLRLAEKSVPLQSLLEAVSPEDSSELRLRTLQPAKVDLTAAFERDGKALAQVSAGSLAELQLPNGPGTLSWLVEKPRPKPKEPQAPLRAEYLVHLREVLLSGDFVQHLAGESLTSAKEEEQGRRYTRRSLDASQAAPDVPLFYLEVAEGYVSAWPGSSGSRFRSAPVRGALDGQGWVRVNPGEDASLSLPGRYVLGGGSGEAGKSMDASVLSAEKHKLGLRLLQFSSGSDTKAAAQADVVLPLGREVEGVPSMYFGGLLWIPLLHVAPENPCTRVVGRALLCIEACRPNVSRDLRLLRQVPLAPAGLYLPLYKDWEAPRPPTCPVPGPASWPLESAVRALAGDDLWKKLNDEAVKPGIISSGAFQKALQAAAESSTSPLFRAASASATTPAASGAGVEDLHFLVATLAPIMADAGSTVPFRPLLLWMGLRKLARLILPIARGLLQQLQQLELKGDAGCVSADGAVTTCLCSVLCELPGRAPGIVAHAVNRSASTVSVALVADLPAALWQLISQRSEWLAGGHWHFDYIVFLWDLQAASGSEVALQGTRGRDTSAGAEKIGKAGTDVLFWPLRSELHLQRREPTVSPRSPVQRDAMALPRPRGTSTSSAGLAPRPLPSLRGFEAPAAQMPFSGSAPAVPAVAAVPAGLPGLCLPGAPRARSPSPFWDLSAPRPLQELGVKNDINETVLRAVSRLSDTELQLRSLSGSEEEQLQQLRARHQQNLESLGMLQKSMLIPSATTTIPAAAASDPARENRERIALEGIGSTPLLGVSALLDLANASASFPEKTGAGLGLGAGPLPPALGSSIGRPSPPESPQPEARPPNLQLDALSQTAGPLPPPSPWMAEAEGSESIPDQLDGRVSADDM